MILSVALIIVGIAAAAWGLPASHRFRFPYDILAAVMFLAGIVAALLGCLLTVVPRFFES